MSEMLSPDDPKPRGMELVEIQPTILGGDPADPKNKTWVTREQHFELVRYWNKIIQQLKSEQDWAA